MAHLLLDHPDYEPLRFAIEDGIVLIGRGAEADIRIPDKSISRLHARMEPTALGLQLEDLASANGTWVNDEPVTAPTFVSVGDSIRIGNVNLRVVAGDRPQPIQLDPSQGDTRGVASDSAVSAAATSGSRFSVWVIVSVAIAVVVVLFVLSTRRDDKPKPEGDRAAGATTPLVPEPTAASKRRDESMPPAMPVDTPPSESSAVPTPVMDGTEMTESARLALESIERKEDSMPQPDSPLSRLAEKTPDSSAITEAPVAPPTRTPPPDEAAQALVDGPSTRAAPPPSAKPDHLRYKGTDSPIATLMDRGIVNETGTLIGTDDDRFLIRRLYLDLLCRTPSAAEYSAGAALTNEELIDRVLAHPERWITWYEDELYFMLLLDDFRPPEDRIRNLPGRLAAGQVTSKDALAEIVKSQYFNARNPGNDTYVTVVLEQMLGITVQKEPQLLEAGKKMYDGYASAIFGKRGKSQGDLVDIAVEHPAFVGTYFARALKRLLGDVPPKTILDPMVKRLIADPKSHDALMREVLLSPAYGKSRDVRRRKTDHQFIRGLWQDLFGRPPTYQELRNVRNATQALADPTGIRSVIVRTLLDGGKVELPEKSAIKPDAWIPEQFQRFLSRRPSQAEVAAFTAAFEKNACKPTTILHAILTGTDYDHY